MTLQELIDDLSALPASARTATVIVSEGDCGDLEPTGIRYEAGEVVIEAFDRYKETT